MLELIQVRRPFDPGGSAFSCSSTSLLLDGGMPRIVSFGKSDSGLKRPNNEDAFTTKVEMGLNVLADGMGGAAAGEVASQIFTQTVLEVFSPPFSQTDQNSLLERLQRSFELSNEKILKHVRENPHHQGMGCTAEVLVFFDKRFIVGHVGDSRTYLFRNNQLRQLTRDHSLVQEQLDQGLIDLAQARNHRLRNVILRAVGMGEELAVDFIRGKARVGDFFLLCSDGLTDMIDDEAIQSILIPSDSIEGKVNKLIESAIVAGGHDNVTVILSEVV